MRGLICGGFYHYVLMHIELLSGVSKKKKANEQIKVE